MSTKFFKVFAVTVALIALVAVGSEAKAADAHATVAGIEASDAQYELHEAINTSTAKLAVLNRQALELAARISRSKVSGPKAARLRKQLAATNADITIEQARCADLLDQLRNTQPAESVPTLPLEPELAPT